MDDAAPSAGFPAEIDWTPPAEMIERQPYLPCWMAGGDGNSLGARAIYLGSTVYWITVPMRPRRSASGYRAVVFEC